MENSPQTSESSSGLDELLESRVRCLSQKLSQPYKLEEIEAELAALNDLVYTYKRRDEMLEKLLDGSTAENKRRQIIETLKAQSIRVAGNQAEIERIHARSRELLQRSSILVIRAQQEINKRAHKYSGYALEACGLCSGLGGNTESPCPTCKGKGTVVVHQPSLKCPRCHGNGKASFLEVMNYAGLCAVCRGSGWVMTSD